MASPNRQEGARDQIECESKSTQHSDPNPNPSQTNFRKTTTYKIKTIDVDDLKKAWRWAQIKYEREDKLQTLGSLIDERAEAWSLAS